MALLKKLLVPLATLALVGSGALSSTGCELISGVDRSQISGTGGGTTTATGTGGTGGGTTTTGGGCTEAKDCPGTDSDCSKRTCMAGVCGVDLTAAGTATTDQSSGDCKKSVCDGAGMTSQEDDNTDILDDNNDCTDDICDAGAPKNNPTMSGQACTSNNGKFCDGKGACVECNDGPDCVSGVCTANTCVPPECTDGVKNGTETDKDCGGADCAPCADGLACMVIDDCESGVCTAGVCAVPTCSDTVKNGVETDKDCGGVDCAPCAPDLGCLIDSDCVGGSCSGAICLPTCTDSVKNANETDQDCGGPTCSACADGKICVVGTDCTSIVCDTGACAAPTCVDAVKNGIETDKDCGGGVCPPCGANQLCGGPADCATGVCMGGTCQAAVCNDNVKNGNETDVDCGGGACPVCAPTFNCTAGTDCSSGICTTGKCTVPACGDGVVNGADACDDGNLMDGDGCSAGCVAELGFTCVGAPLSVCTSSCGDGTKASNEACDDGNGTDGDGCTACAADFGFGCVGTTPSVCTSSCGDGKKASNEACDDGNGAAADGCTACVVDFGFGCAGVQPSVCTSSCGDGNKASNEACDDGNGNAGDGCAACVVEAGYACVGTTPSVCTPICGDGLLKPGEICDDGNLLDGDCCSSTCQFEAGCEVEPNGAFGTANAIPLVAGAGMLKGRIIPSGDQDFYSFTLTQISDVKIETFDNSGAATCVAGATNIDTVVRLFAPNGVTELVNDDDGGVSPCSKIDPPVDAPARQLAPGTYFVRVERFGNATVTPVYRILITLTAICGDGTKGAFEGCDDTNNLPGDGCAANCVPEPGFSCVGSPSVCTLVCGNGVLDAGETCDEGGGNHVGGDGCSASCTIEAGYGCVGTPSVCTLNCGNSVIDAGEQCDEGGGNLADGDGCSSTCQVEAGYACAGTPSVCFLSCGNGLIDGGDECDEGGGNVANGDGCDSSCKVEPGYTCAGTPSVCVFTCGDHSTTGNEQCDDGGLIPGDGCSAVCQWETINEVEPNNNKADADASVVQLSGSAVISGSISAAADKDVFKFTLASLQAFRVEVFDKSGRDCVGMPTNTITLFDSNFVQLKTDAVGTIASGIGVCAALVGSAPAGTYYLQVGGSAAGNYLLQIKALTDDGFEIEPNDLQAQALAAPGRDLVVTGQLTAASDADWYKVTLPATLSIRAETIEGGLITCESFNLDTFLTVFTPAAVQLVTDDDDGRGFCSALDGTGATPRDAALHNLAAGDYFIQVTGFDALADYRLAVTTR